jgi:hypothetical protein
MAAHGIVNARWVMVFVIQGYKRGYVIIFMNEP